MTSASRSGGAMVDFSGVGLRYGGVTGRAGVTFAW